MDFDFLWWHHDILRCLVASTHAQFCSHKHHRWLILAKETNPELPHCPWVGLPRAQVEHLWIKSHLSSLFARPHPLGRVAHPFTGAVFVLKELPISVQIFDCWLANFQSKRDLWKLRKPRQLSEVKSVTYCQDSLARAFRWYQGQVGVLIADSDFPMCHDHRNSCTMSHHLMGCKSSVSNPRSE